MKRMAFSKYNEAIDEKANAYKSRFINFLRKWLHVKLTAMFVGNEIDQIKVALFYTA